MSLAKHGIGILMYGTQQKLEGVQSFRGLIKLNSTKNAKSLREALSEFGYSIKDAFLFMVEVQRQLRNKLLATLHAPIVSELPLASFARRTPFLP